MSWLRLISFGALFCSAVFATSGTVQAQEFAWVKRTTTKGCIFYQWTRPGADDGTKYEWDGACTMGELIDGGRPAGTDSSDGAGRLTRRGPEIKRLEGIDAIAWGGSFKNGVMDGLWDMGGCDFYCPSRMAMGCEQLSTGENIQGCVPGTAPVVTSSAPRTPARAGWQVYTTREGCFLYGDPRHSKVYSDAELEWRGSCTEDKWVHGQGSRVIHPKPGKRIFGSENPVFEPRIFNRGCTEADISQGCIPNNASAAAASAASSDAPASPATAANIDEDPWAAPVAAAPAPSPAQTETSNPSAIKSPFPENGPLSEEGRIGKPIRNTGWEKDCINEIKQLQVSSQSWPGPVQEISFKLGTEQKAMFEGKCAGHPEAAAYIAGAENMIAKGQAAAPQTPEQQPAPGSEETGLAFLPTPSGNLVAPPPDMSDKQHVIWSEHPDGKCINLLPYDGPGFGGFANSCNYRIEMHYCIADFVEYPGAMNWGSSFQCEKQQFGALTVGPNSKVGAHTRGGKSVQWYACKSPDLPGKVEYRNGQVFGLCK